MRERTLPRILADQVARQGERPFLAFEDQRYSYAEADRICNRLAGGLARLGVAKGTHVAMLMNNSAEQLFTYFAIGKLGAVLIPINGAARGEQLHYFIEQSDATMIVLEAPLLARYLEIQARAPAIRQVILFDETGDLTADQRRKIAVPTVDFSSLLDSADTPPDVDVRFNDLFYLSYTSGTTGPSKGNMATHARCMTNALDQIRAYGYRSDDVLYTCLPLFHDNAFMACVLPALVAGAQIAVSRRFSASRFWDEVRGYGATQFNLLGAMSNIIWSQPERPDDADNQVRQCMVVPTPTEFYHDFETRFGLKFTSLYGLTDFGLVTYNGPDAPPEKWASAGKAVPEITVKIFDEEDFELPPGEVGEIVLRAADSWRQSQGYYNMPAATAQACRNLWFHSGDRGYLDADGYLYFVDRKKDAIRRRGENISSYEVEQIVLKHAAVEDAAVYAVTSEMSEDEVMVSVMPRPGAVLSEAELIAHCQDNMAYFMVPRFVEFLPDLPRTASEKVQKYKLRETAEARLGEVWDREKAGIVLKR